MTELLYLLAVAAVCSAAAIAFVRLPVVQKARRKLYYWTGERMGTEPNEDDLR